MYYIVETKKSFDLAPEDLEISVKRYGFGILHIHHSSGHSAQKRHCV